MNTRTQTALSIVNSGGYITYALETNRYTGRTQFKYRLHQVDGNIVKGYGYSALTEAIPHCRKEEIYISSSWEQRYISKDTPVSEEEKKIIDFHNSERDYK